MLEPRSSRLSRAKQWDPVSEQANTLQWATVLSRHFSKKSTQMTNKPWNDIQYHLPAGKCKSTSRKSHFTHITVAKNRKNIETGIIYTNMEKSEPPTLLLECKGARTLWKTWRSSSNVKRGVTIWLRCLLKRLETFSYKTCTWMLRLALPTIAKKREHPRGLSTDEETSKTLHSHVMDLYLTTRGNKILAHGNSLDLESIIQ